MKRGYRDWGKIVAELKSSGKSKSDLSKELGMSLSEFNRNIRRFEGTSKNRPLKKATSKQVFAEVAVETHSIPACIRITTSSGCVVEVPL